jgi:hypothetical protein
MEKKEKELIKKDREERLSNAPKSLGWNDVSAEILDKYKGKLYTKDGSYNISSIRGIARAAGIPNDWIKDTGRCNFGQPRIALYIFDGHGGNDVVEVQYLYDCAKWALNELKRYGAVS